MRRLFVTGLLFAVACSKSDAPKPEDKPAPADKPGDDKPAENPGVKPADPAPAPTAKIKQATNSDDLGKLPIDSDLVIGVDVAAVQTSPMWKDFIAPRVMAGDAAAKLDEFKQKCGIDPLAVIKTATIGLKDVAGGKEGVIVVHGPDKAQVAACGEKMKADKAAKVDITQDGDVTILKPKSGGVPVAFQFITDSDAVIAIGARANAAGIKAILEGKGGLATSGAFVDMYNRVETEKSMWWLMNAANNAAMKGLATLGIKPTHLFGAVDVSDGLVVDMRMRVPSQDQATQAATMMKSQLGPAAGMLKMDKLDVASEGQDIKFSVLVSKANLGPMLDSLKGLAATMGGGAMGGGMGAP